MLQDWQKLTVGGGPGNKAPFFPCVGPAFCCSVAKEGAFQPRRANTMGFVLIPIKKNLRVEL